MTSFVAKPSLTVVFDRLHYAIKNYRKDLGMWPKSDPVTVCGMLGQGLDYMAIVACIFSILLLLIFEGQNVSL